MSDEINPILVDVPQEIVGERVLIRALRAGDGSLVYPSVRESLAELRRWMPWATDDYNRETCEEWCRRAAADILLRKQLGYAILLRKDGRHIGGIGAGKINWNVPACEIGYWVHTAHTKRGYATEAVGILLGMLRDRLGMKRVEIRCHSENRASRRVAERAGFEMEGILRNDSRGVDGSLRSTCVFSWIG
jgi:ribosomal-protein-serine acetyltransferase